MNIIETKPNKETQEKRELGYDGQSMHHPDSARLQIYFRRSAPENLQRTATHRPQDATSLLSSEKGCTGTEYQYPSKAYIPMYALTFGHP